MKQPPIGSKWVHKTDGVIYVVERQGLHHILLREWGNEEYGMICHMDSFYYDFGPDTD